MEIQKYPARKEDLVVFETNNIEVFVPRWPHTHATYGGHLVIRTKTPHVSCISLTGDESLDVWAAVQACTELMMNYLGALRTNNQDNGNWAYLPGHGGKPRFHFHIYGRSHTEDSYDGPGYQRWGLSLNFPHPTELARIDGEPAADGAVWLEYIEPYTDEQVEFIRNMLPKLFVRAVQ